MPWDIFNVPEPFTVGLGLGFLDDQRASLAGVDGNLLELGNLRITWRSGRIGVEFTGAMSRRYYDQQIEQAPIEGTDAPTGKPRHDAGDVLAWTMLRLAGQDRGMVALRFGTRLPTTSNEPGMDRDRTDFFTSLGGRWRGGIFSVGGDAGLGILGTRTASIDQLDVLTYGFNIDAKLGPLTSSGAFTGQTDLHSSFVRGDEDLSEIRVGLRGGERTFVSLTAIKGLLHYSPDIGLQLMVGVRR